MTNLESFYTTVFNKNGQWPPFKSLSETQLNQLKSSFEFSQFMMNKTLIAFAAQLNKVAYKMQRTIEFINSDQAAK
jgi:hypothetical protein